MERVRLLCLMIVAAYLAGCGKPAPQLGNFKRAPDPEPVPKAAPAQPGPASPTPAPAATGSQGVSPAGNPGAPPVAAPVVPKFRAADTVKIEPVDPNWPEEKKHEQTVARLRKIALALHEYAAKEGRFPPAPGQLHSWRVRLLPYLGHAELLGKFNLQEPWDSDANAAAAKEAPPPVYQSPWRKDDLTCFLAPLGQNTVLASPAGTEAARLNDHWSGVVELLMVDDAHAVPWSKPADYVVDTASDRPIGNLSQERTGMLVALADGQVRWLPSNAPGQSVRLLLTIGGDEFVSASALTREADAALPFFQIQVSFNSKKEDVGGGASDPPIASIGTPLSPKQEENRVPLPSDDEVEKARALLKQVFKEEIERTKKADKTRSRHDLAVALLQNAGKVEADAAAHFVLLQTARDSAAATGDFKLAQLATESLIKTYQVDNLDLRRRTVVESGKELLPYYEQQNEDLRKECEQLLKLALEHDDFAAAKDVFAVYAETTRRRKPERPGDPGSSRQELQRLQAIEKEIENFKRAYASVPPALKTLRESPDDSEANYTLGAYLCLAKFQWLAGAKHLVKGSNLRLKVLATEDMAPPVGPVAMSNLANEYWALSEQETGLFKRGLQLRAVYWYRQALPSLATGLAKVQAERRSLEADKTYGEVLVKEALAMMDPNLKVSVAQSLD